MQQDVTWFVSASATQAPTLHHLGLCFLPPLPKNIYLCWLLSGISHFRLVPQIPQAAGAAHSGTGKDPTPKHLGIVSSPHSEFPSLSSRREFLCQLQKMWGRLEFQDSRSQTWQAEHSQDASGLLIGFFFFFFFFFSKFYLLWPKEESLCVPL